MGNVLRGFKPKYSEKEIKSSEELAGKELNDFIEELQTKHDVVIVPDVIIGINALKGVVPVTSSLKVVSNKRFKK